MDLLTPRRSPNSALPLHTQKQCTARGSSWGLTSLSLTTKGSWIHLGGGSPSLSSALWSQYPRTYHHSKLLIHSIASYYCQAGAVIRGLHQPTGKSCVSSQHVNYQLQWQHALPLSNPVNWTSDLLNPHHSASRHGLLCLVSRSPQVGYDNYRKLPKTYWNSTAKN